ncbi:MAG TPA: hypothetical protein VGH38_07245, partial [Bryobacteraceae bacterium]
MSRSARSWPSAAIRSDGSRSAVESPDGDTEQDRHHHFTRCEAWNNGSGVSCQVLWGLSHQRPLAGIQIRTKLAERGHQVR